MANSFSDAPVLVTGADGFIGRHLVRRLLAEKTRVTAFVRERPQALGGVGLSLGQDVVEVDLRRAADVKRAIKHADPRLVFHVAAAGVSDPFLPIQEALRVNLSGTLNLLRAVAGRVPVVVTRTSGEKHALNVYAASKAAAWEFCRMFARTEGWPVVGAIIFQCYGRGQSGRSVLPVALAAARSGQDFLMSPGKQIRDWITVNDVVEGLLAMAAAELPTGSGVDLGTGLGTELRQVVKMLFDLVGAQGQPRLGALPYRPGEAMHVTADARRTKAITDWRARIKLEDGLRELIAVTS